MVHISSETIDGFKKMFKEQYDVEYSESEAWEATHNLLGAFDWLLKQDMKQNPENYKKKINSDERGRVKNSKLTDENIEALKELGGVLQSIHNRLVLEGYEIKENSITKKSTQ